MQTSKYIITSFVLLVLISACETKTAEDNTPVQNAPRVVSEKPANASMEVSEAASADKGQQTISVTGYIDVPPENLASISPYYGGFAKNIYVLPGQSVKKGEVLFTLQNPEYLHMQLEYLEAKEQIEYLKAAYERQKTLAAEKISSTKIYKKAESDYKVMLARYRSLQEELKLMGLSIPKIESGQLINTISIRAIIKGSVTAVNITKGEFVDAKDVAVTIVNTDHIHLELDVFEKDALLVKEGQLVTFKIPESSQELYKGDIHLVGRSVDPKKRTIKVHGHIDNEDEANFIQGMFVEASIEVNKAK